MLVITTDDLLVIAAALFIVLFCALVGIRKVLERRRQRRPER